MTRGRERNTAPPWLQCQAYVVCVYICMYAHTYRKEIYGSWSPEKHVKLQGKEEEEEYGRRGGRREKINSIRSFFTWLPPFERTREASTKWSTGGLSSRTSQQPTLVQGQGCAERERDRCIPTAESQAGLLEIWQTVAVSSNAKRIKNISFEAIS